MKIIRQEMFVSKSPVATKQTQTRRSQFSLDDMHYRWNEKQIFHFPRLSTRLLINIPVSVWGSPALFAHSAVDETSFDPSLWAGLKQKRKYTYMKKIKLKWLKKKKEAKCGSECSTAPLKPSSKRHCLKQPKTGEIELVWNVDFRPFF